MLDMDVIMPVVVDPKTLGVNLFLVISGLLLLVVVGVVALGGWTGFRAWWQQRHENESWEAYRQSKLGPDGRPWPPSTVGACQQCRQRSSRIFHLDTGQELCHDCYVLHCRENSTIR